MVFLPIVFAAASDAVVALGRISKFLVAEELQEPFQVDENSKWDVEVKGGNFEWETIVPEDPAIARMGMGGGRGGKGGKGSGGKKGKKNRSKSVLPTHSAGASTTTVGAASTTTATTAVERAPPQEPEAPFALKDIELKIPKGSFIAFVGRVGSGKSSLMQALIGEMRKTEGEVRRVLFCF